MKILAIGDVVGNGGIVAISNKLNGLRRQYGADFVIVNGENANMAGITPRSANDIFDAGADVITLGNHAYRKKSICTMLDENGYMLRPYNMAPQLPGYGYSIYNIKGIRVIIAVFLGRCDMTFGPDNPFLMADKLLKKEEDNYDMAIMEMHTNATSEKRAFGYYLDGRASVVFGTHTHIQTADEEILPNGTGYITDIGMCGCKNSVLGIKKEQSIALFRGDLTERFEEAVGECGINGAAFEIDEVSKKCINIERIKI